MVTYLSELHEQIQIELLLIIGAVTFLEQRLVDLDLRLSESHINMYLLLLWKSLLNLFLGASKHEGSEYFMQLLNHINILLLKFLL